MNILNPREVRRKTKKEGSRTVFWVWTFALLAAGSLAIYVLLDLEIFHSLAYLSLFKKLALLSTIGFTILSVSRIVERAVPTRSAAARYNLIRLIRLLVVMIILGVGIS